MNPRQLARKLYIFDRASMQAIADQVGKTPRTVARWKNEARKTGDDWDRARAAHLISGGGLDGVVSGVVEELVVLVQKTIEETKADNSLSAEDKARLLTSLSDAMVKAVKSAGAAAPKLSDFAVAQDILRRLLDFVAEHYPQHADAISEIIEPFGRELMEAYQ